MLKGRKEAFCLRPNKIGMWYIIQGESMLPEISETPGHVGTALFFKLILAIKKSHLFFLGNHRVTYIAQ